MENKLIDLGKLSEPLSKLIEVIGAGIGTLYGPFGTIRQAKADAGAKIIMATAEKEIADLNCRAKSRLEYQEAVRQYNIEKIAVHAANSLPEVVSDKTVDRDWVFQFIECAQNVCDEDMQILWGKILAGETSEPGSYSKRTLHFLKSLEKWEAELFTKYCAFSFEREDGWPIVFCSKGARRLIIEKCGVDPSSHFENIGILSGDFVTLVPSKIVGKKIFYFDQEYIFVGKPNKHILEIGVPYHRFSLIGRQIFKIAGPESCSGLIQAVSDDIGKSDNLKLISAQSPTS
jgi:Protein of unknown function (DUF2806)